MDFDVIIPTYNRCERASKTIEKMLSVGLLGLNRIIVIDSTDHYTKQDFPENSKIQYVKSSHKNAAYQRFLGSLIATSSILIFLDDDMDITDVDNFIENLNVFEDEKIVGLNIGFKNINSFFDTIPRNKTYSWSNPFFNCLKWLTGFPNIDTNRFWLCGLRGSRCDNKPIEYMSGGAFAARREIVKKVYDNYDFNIFCLLEKGLGKGEDVLFGYALSCQGVVWAGQGCCFVHDDQGDSTFTQDLYSFNCNKAVSRLFLSLEFSRLSKRSLAIAYIHYHWYVLWRSMSMLLTCLLKPSSKQYQSLLGWLAGWRKAWCYKFLPLKETQQYWEKEANKDIKNCNF